LRLSDEHARSLAATGLVGLILAVTANGQPRSVGPISLDTIVVCVPIAIVMCLPYVRRKGVDAVPRYLMGAAALAFLVWGLLSVVANGGQLSSLLTMVRYASYFLLAIVVSVVAQDAPIRRLLLWVIGVTAGMTSVLSFLQFKYPQFTPGMNGISPEISTRVVGTFYNSNFYAEYLLLAIGVLGALFFTERGRPRVTAAVLGVLTVGALLLTYTRGSWLALAIAVVIFVTVVDVRYLFVVAMAGAVSVLVVPGVAARLTQSSANAGSADFRLGLWKVAGAAMGNRPLFGYAPGDFLTAYREIVIARPELFQGYLGFGAHNAYFALAAETGVLGGILFFVATALHATRGVFVATRKGIGDAERYTALALSCVLIGFIANTFTSNTFQHPQSGLFFWILSGIVAAVGAGTWNAGVRDVGHAPNPAAAETSLITRPVLAVRDFVGRMWRGSFAFAWSAEPRKAAASWFGSSAVMRFVFGSGDSRASGER
jgi:O-antigen ligase